MISEGYGSQEEDEDDAEEEKEEQAGSQRRRGPRRRSSRRTKASGGQPSGKGVMAAPAAALSATLSAEYARIKLSTRTLGDLATEAAAKRAEVEALVGSIEDGKREILANQSHVAKSWLDRQLLSNLVAEVEELVERVQEAADGEAREWSDATAALRKRYAQNRWGGLQRRQQKELERDKLGGLLEGVAVDDEAGTRGVVFVLKAEDGEADSRSGGSSSDGRSQWTWSDHEAAKLQLAKRRQAEAAQAELERLQELLQSYHAKHVDGAQRLEEGTARLREEKRATMAMKKARTAEAEERRRARADEARMRRREVAATNAAVAEEQKVASEQAKIEMIEARQAARARKVAQAEERRQEVAARDAQDIAKAKQRLEKERKRPTVVRWEKPPKPLTEEQVVAMLPPPPHPRAAAHAQLSESYSEAGLYDKALAEANTALAVAEGAPFLSQLQASAKALAGLGEYDAAVSTLQQAERLNCREEERERVRTELWRLQKVAAQVQAAAEASMIPIY